MFKISNQIEVSIIKYTLNKREGLMKKNAAYSMLVLSAIVALGISLLSCGSAKINAEHSPRLENATIGSYSRDTESSQYVEVDLIFDRDITVVDDKCESLRITIADERVQEDEYTLTQGNESNIARLTINVEAITKGVLRVEKEKEEAVISEIRSSDGEYAADDFSLEGMIPSGVTLSTVESEAGRVVKSVDSRWNIRSIAWVGLVENGKLVPVSETRSLEMLDGYAAVHGHEFLMEDEEDIAESITDVLRSNYGNEYSFSCDGNRVTAEKANSDAELDIDIYGYMKINE